MPVDCWSAHIAEERKVEDLRRLPNSDIVELISLGAFPIPLASKLLVWGKVTYLTGQQMDPGPDDPAFFLISTSLHDSRLTEHVDDASSNLNLRHPGATTVSLQGAIDAPPDHLGAPHSLSMRTELTGRDVLVVSVWLSAIEVDTLHMQPA